MSRSFAIAPAPVWTLERHTILSPAEVLDRYPALTMTQVAYVLNLTHRRGHRKGEPDRSRSVELVRDGRLRVIDPSQPTARWTVGAAEVRRYLASTTVT